MQTSNKEEALVDFLKGLRIVLNNASAYSKDHPYFKKSVETFKDKVNTLFHFLSPITITVNPDSLFIDGKNWQKTEQYIELAQLFHRRKVKGIELKVGITTEELLDFLSRVSLPIKEFLRQGGFKNILDNVRLKHLSIEELDYSRLLLDAGEESKDIWIYLLKEAIGQEDLGRIKEFADNFDKIVTKFKAKDLCQDEEFGASIGNFLNYLKTQEKSNFYHCTKTLLRLALSDKKVSDESQPAQINKFFTDLNKEDITETLLETISKDDSYNYLNFQVFQKLFEKDTHRELASILEKRLKNPEFLKTNPKIIKKIKELFSAPEEAAIPSFYRNAFSWLTKDEFLGATLSFDRRLLQVNYCFLLINLLMQEENPETSNLILKHLLKECDKLIEEVDLALLKFIWEALDKKTKEDASLVSPVSLLEELEERITGFIEELTFKEEVSEGSAYFTDKLRKSARGLDFYLDNIFVQGRVNPEALKLLFKFFPLDLNYVYENLEKKHSEIDLVAKIIKSLEKIDSLVSLGMLKKIFSFSNNIIKAEVLRAMQGLSLFDEQFLMPLLKNEETFLQKEAMAILSRNEISRRQAIEEFLSLPSPWGRKNKVLIERLRIIQDMGLREAEGFVEAFSKRRSFWNSNLRKMALEVLKDWHERRD